MSLRWKRIKIHIHFSFLIYMAILYLIDGIAQVLGLLFALMVHETAHLVVGCFLHEPFEQIEITPFGGVIRYRPDSSSSKGIKGSLISVSGPAANYAVILILSAIPQAKGFMLNLQRATIVANMSMLFLNLLPVLPLDGGRFAFSIGYYLFPISSLLTVLSYLGCAVGITLTLFSLYGCFLIGKLNISLLLVGLYIVVCSRKEHTLLLISNYHTVLCEKRHGRPRGTKAELRYLPENERLLSILPYLCDAKHCICVTSIDKSTVFIDEDILISAVLKDPLATIAEVFRKQKQTLSETF